MEVRLLPGAPSRFSSNDIQRQGAAAEEHRVHQIPVRRAKSWNTFLATRSPSSYPLQLPNNFTSILSAIHIRYRSRPAIDCEK